MSYKTILVCIDDTDRAKHRIALAAEMAINEGAHLIGVADTGISRFIYQDGNISGVDPSLLNHLEYLRERATQNIADFNAQVTQLGVTSFESEIAQDDAVGGVGLMARYSDLVIVGQTDPNDISLNDLPEYMILHSGRPVLVIPHTGKFSQIGKRPLIAWDGSRAARRAISDSLPLLLKAKLAHLVIINPDQSHGKEPGADIIAYLDRHGIKPSLSVLETKLNVGSVLLQTAADLNSDVIIMGGYGHSRFREMIMGGVTRDILKHMNIPAILSH